MNKNVMVSITEFESNVLRDGEHVVYFHKSNGVCSSRLVQHGSPSHDRVRQITEIERVDREFRCTTRTSNIV